MNDYAHKTSWNVDICNLKVIIFISLLGALN